jgi:hypothetical protein
MRAYSFDDCTHLRDFFAGVCNAPRQRRRCSTIYIYIYIHTHTHTNTIFRPPGGGECDLNEVCSELQLSAISHDFMLEEMMVLLRQPQGASFDVSMYVFMYI